MLVVAGSGEVGRDGNVSGFKFKLDTYKELTEFVTGLGFAVLRYDKRGVAKSEGSFLETGVWNLIDPKIFSQTRTGCRSWQGEKQNGKSLKT